MNRLLAILAAALIALPALAQSPPTTGTGTGAGTDSTATAPKAPLIDINRASATELETLPGIGPERAKAIIKGRPYKGKDDLLQRKIIPSNVYKDIRGKIIAKKS